jgi:hypothetical protein
VRRERRPEPHPVFGVEAVPGKGVGEVDDGWGDVVFEVALHGN